MTLYIDEILKRPEGKTLEFKRDLSSPRPMLKTLLAFANTAGGRLIVGVDDDRRVIGVEHPLDEEERLCSLIADSINRANHRSSQNRTSRGTSRSTS